MGRVRCMKMTSAAFAALLNKDGEIMYFVNDTGSFSPESLETCGKIYVGDKLVADGTDVDWSEIINKPTTFTPSAHDHNRLLTVNISESDFNNANWSGFYNVLKASESSLPGSPTTGNVAIHAACDNGYNTAGLDILINDSTLSNLHYRARVGGGGIGQWKTLFDSSNYTTWINTTSYPGLNYVGTVTSVAMTSAATGLQISGSPITTSGVLNLQFSEGYSLPTNASQSNWDTAYSQTHTHSNKSVLDGISSSDITNWNLAYTNNHTHANKSVLDGISSTDISNWNTAYGWGNHYSEYLPLSGGTMTGSIQFNGTRTNHIYFPNDGDYTHYYEGSSGEHFSIGYGRIQGYSNIYINADTDGSLSEYILLTAGRGVTNSTSNGLAIGYNTLTWLNYDIWHAGNDGSGSGLDADTLDGVHNGEVTSLYFKNTLNSGFDANSPSAPIMMDYGSGNPRSNMPSGFSYGGVFTTYVSGNTGMRMLFAWDNNHDSSTTSNKLWWRNENNLGWTSAWKQIAFLDSNVASATYATSAGDADTLDGQHGSYYAPASSLNSYLPLSGGMMTGIIGRDAGGSWISARDNVLIKTTRTSSDGIDWHPAVGIKTSVGFWSFGSVGGESLCLSYDTDENYNNNNNSSAVINFPAAGSTGTLALTSQIPYVYNWALQPTKPSYAFSEITGQLATASQLDYNYISIAGNSVALGGSLQTSTLQSSLGLGQAAYKNIGSVQLNDNDLVTGHAVLTAINNALTAAMKFEGTTTTPLVDGSTTNPVTINGNSVTAYKGMVVIGSDTHQEFVWDGSQWEVLGDEGSYALKTTSITGTGYLTGGGDLSQNRTIDITLTVKNYIDHGESAYNSLGNYLPLAGGTMTGKITFNQDSSHRDRGIVGVYDYAKYAAIWAMGSDYLIAADGSTLGSLYGAAYMYNRGYGGDHQFVWALNGDIHAAIGEYIWSVGGFKKYNSSDSYVLLGGGGHKLESSLNVSTAESSTTAEYPAGFTGRGSGWSGVDGTLATDWSVSGANIEFRYYNGYLNVVTDGAFYQRNDIVGSSQRVLDAYDLSNTTWGNADTVDNEHASAFAHIGAHNNLTASGNEFTFASDAFSGDLWINYRTASGGVDGAITGYYFGNGAGGSLAYISNGRFSGSAGSVRDAGNDTNITFHYSSGGYSSNPSYLAAWNGYDITYVAPSYVTVGAASSLATTHYWADVPISTSSNNATTPTFSWATFSRVSEHGVRAGTFRGLLVGNCTGEYMHLYERVHIGSPAGWGSREAPTYGLSTYGGAWLATDTGNVAIGHTNPSYKLHVKDSATDNNPPLYIEGTNSSDTWSHIASFINPNRTTTRNRIFLGIGTGLSYKNCGALEYYYAGNNSNNNYLGIGFYGNDDLMIVKADGNVGVGTTAPQVKMLVAGGLAVIDDSSNTYYNALAYFRTMSSVDWGVVIDKGGSYDYGLDISVGGSYALRNRGGSRLVGSVKIGADAAPSEALDVTGNIVASGDLRVSGNDVYVGASSGNQCHQQYNATTKCLCFKFD